MFLFLHNSILQLSVFLSSLSNNLKGSYEKEVAVVIEKEEVFIDITVGIPLGLIANEIITNSYKYAFGKENDTPQLNIKCYKTGNNVCVCFEDNGPGYDLSSENVGMGLGIVKDLCEQIDVKIEFLNSNGAKITLIFEGS